MKMLGIMHVFLFFFTNAKKLGVYGKKAEIFSKLNSAVRKIRGLQDCHTYLFRLMTENVVVRLHDLSVWCVSCSSSPTNAGSKLQVGLRLVLQYLLGAIYYIRTRRRKSAKSNGTINNLAVGKLR